MVCARLYTTSLLLIAGVTVSACVDASAPPLIPPPLDQLPSKLQISPNAIIIAQGDSMLLQPVAMSLAGDSLPVGEDTPITWSSDDVGTVSVDERGMMVAHETMLPDNVVNITARATFNGVTKEAVATVNVTSTKLPVAGIRIIPKDSNRTSWAPGAAVFTWVTLVGVDANEDSVMVIRAPIYGNDTIPESQVLPLYLGQLGTLIGGAPYGIQSKLIGDYWLYTHSNVYGVSVKDSLNFTGLYAYSTEIPIVRDSATNMVMSIYANQDVIVQPCGEITFQNQLSVPIDIVFDDPDKATGCTPLDQTGNIENIGAGKIKGRKFREPGRVKWTFRDRETGQLLPYVSGTIVMREP